MDGSLGGQLLFGLISPETYAAAVNAEYDTRRAADGSLLPVGTVTGSPAQVALAESTRQQAQQEAVVSAYQAGQAAGGAGTGDAAAMLNAPDPLVENLTGQLAQALGVSSSAGPGDSGQAAGASIPWTLIAVVAVVYFLFMR